MTRSKKAKSPYTKADVKAVLDNPEWTRADMAKAKRFDEMFPDVAAKRRGRGPNRSPTKTAVSLRLSPEVLDFYKSQGPGWQSRINDDLKKRVARKAKAS